MVRRLILAGCLALGLGSFANAAPPERVVSINLCTDQLAMLLAAPGQLLSVSILAQDPVSSAMAEQASAYPVNHGLAEEIVRLRPDLVLAGTYSAPMTVAMLQRLNIRVVTFDQETDFDSLRANIRKMGQTLGQDTRAEAMIADFDRELALLSDVPTHRPRAALYYANGYTSGDDSLAGHILDAAGLNNIAAEAGVPSGGSLSLEKLVLANPELLIRGTRFPGSSRSEDILDHPALERIGKISDQTAFAGKDWVCGTPYVLRAIAQLRNMRLTLPQGARP